MSVPQSPQRIHFLDALRVIAICAIVLLHVAGSYWYGLDVDTNAWQAMNLYDCVTRWGVPVFVMISGALFLDPGRPQSIGKLWTKSIPHIVVLILFWGIVYALLYHLPQAVTPGEFLGFLKYWVFGPQHFWFLFMLIGLYVLVPVLRCITANETVLKYFLVLGLVCNLVVPALLDGGRLPVVQELVDMFMIRMPLGYVFYFALGYFLVSHTVPRVWRIVLYVAGALSLGAAVAASAWVSLTAGAPDNTLIASTYPYLLASAAIFVAVRQFFAKRPHDESRVSSRVLRELSACTLGVYAIHIIVLRALMAAGLSATAFEPFLAVPLLALATIAISFAFAWLLRRIPFVGRHFV